MHYSEKSSLTTSAMVASVLIYSLSIVLITVSPIMAGLYADQLSLSVSEVGWILSIEEAGAVAGALLAFWLASRVRWKTLLVSASIVAIVANFLTGSTTELASLAITRFASGVASNTVTLIASCLLARAAQPDRAFGTGLLVSCVINALWVWLLNTARQTLGYEMTIGAGALLFVTTALLSFFLPRHLGGPRDTWRFANDGIPDETVNPWPARAGLTGLVLFGISLSMVWGFLERLASANGLSSNAISWAFGLGLLGSGVGALAPTLFGDAGNRIRMLLITTSAVFVALGLTWYSREVIMFTVSVSLLAGAWNMGLAYYMAQTSTNDTNGRYTRAIYIAIAGSQSIGPAIAALLLSHATMLSVFLFSPLPAAFALLFVVLVKRKMASRTKIRVAATV